MSKSQYIPRWDTWEIVIFILWFVATIGVAGLGLYVFSALYGIEEQTKRIVLERAHYVESGKVEQYDKEHHEPGTTH